MRGEFPETLCIEQGVVLSFRFAERKVRRAPRVLRMAVVSQSSVTFGKKRVLLVGETNFVTLFIRLLGFHLLTVPSYCSGHLDTVFHSLNGL